MEWTPILLPPDPAVTSASIDIVFFHFVSSTHILVALVFPVKLPQLALHIFSSMVIKTSSGLLKGQAR
jgi:hypothetical protein